MEVWKDIKKYESVYQVSNLGKVKRLKGYGCTKEKILRSFLCGKNYSTYLKVRLYKKGKGKDYSVHRLMALSFLKNPHNYPEVRHLDGNRFNNTLPNLAFGTHQMNMHDAIKHGTFRTPDNTGIKNGMSKLTENNVRKIRKFFYTKGLSRKQISIKFNISVPYVGQIINGSAWKHIV